LIQEISNTLENIREGAENTSDKEEPNPDEGDQEDFDIAVSGVIYTGESWSSEEFPNAMPVYRIIGTVTVDVFRNLKPDKKEPKEKPLVLPQVDPRIQAAGTLDITI
jgi:hypothetical protein